MKQRKPKSPSWSELKELPMVDSPWPISVEKAMRQYDTEDKAKKFASKWIGCETDRREKSCIMKALAIAKIGRGASVLDIPCGAGRLLPLLKQMGYKVTGADISAPMLQQARLYAGLLGEDCLDETDNLQLANIFQTSFSDNYFDAVVCNRLLHYFPEPHIRQRALKELRRICRGPIILSFLCSFALDEVTSRASDRIRGRKPHGCRAIDCTTFANDARQAGLVVKKWIPVRPVISRRWYAVLERDTARDNRTAEQRNSILWPKLGGKLGRVAAAAAVIIIGLLISRYWKMITDPHEAAVERLVKKYQDGNDHFYVSADRYLEDLRTTRNLSVISVVSDVPERIATDRAELEDSYFLISCSDLKKIKKTATWRQLSVVREFDLAGERFVLLTTELSNKPIKRKTSQTTLPESPRTWV